MLVGALFLWCSLSRHTEEDYQKAKTADIFNFSILSQMKNKLRCHLSKCKHVIQAITNIFHFSSVLTWIKWVSSLLDSNRFFEFKVPDTFMFSSPALNTVNSTQCVFNGFLLNWSERVKTGGCRLNKDTHMKAHKQQTLCILNPNT